MAFRMVILGLTYDGTKTPSKLPFRLMNLKQDLGLN